MTKYATLFLVILTCVLLPSCNTKVSEEPVKASSELHLPDLESIFKEFQIIDSTQNYQDFASKIYKENSDLKSPELYTYSAMFYGRAEMADSTLIALGRAIDNGMSNPKIIEKYQWADLVSKSELYPKIEERLDSIATALKEVKNFSLKLKSMTEFWPYLERAQQDSANAESIFKEFIFEGPKELRDYYIVRYQSLDYMKYQLVKESPKYYQYLSNQFNADSIKVMKSQIEGWMKGFKKMYPEAVFPNVYIVPGLLNSGGTLSESGLYIGGDMYGRSDDMPLDGLNDWQKKVIMKTSDMPTIIMHELMHFEQNYQDPAMKHTVKGMVMGEGVADFLAELLSGKEFKNERTEFLNDKDNWNMIVTDFKETRDTDDISLWLFNGDNVEDRPGDLGYTLGQYIAKSYYNKCSDKKQAIYNLLNTDNVDEIYKESDYAYLLD